MMRVNLFRPVRVKTTSEKRRALPTARKLLQDKAIAIANDIRGLRRNFGRKAGVIEAVTFDQWIRLVECMPEYIEIKRRYPPPGRSFARCSPSSTANYG
jgi:transposase